MADIPIIPSQVSTGMIVDIPFATAVNESEGGNSGRLSTRDIPLRNYTITVNPDDAAEVMAIILAVRGARWPVALRDWAGNYQLTNETLAHSSTTVPITRTFTPVTGSRTFSQRILMIDETDEDFVVKKNGTTQTEGGDYTISDPGNIVFSSLSGGDVVTVTGQYLVPVVFVEDTLSLNVHIGGNGEVGALYSIENLRLREIPEDEFTALIS